MHYRFRVKRDCLVDVVEIVDLILKMDNLSTELRLLAQNNPYGCGNRSQKWNKVNEVIIKAYISAHFL
ncbi:MAG: hypothetical protein RL285_1681 [Bacteroidota bacterium]